MYFNANGEKEITYDAIVIGTGISGGWAAKELCEKGLKTLVLERGRMVRHPDYPTANMDTWDLPHRNRVPKEQLADYQVQKRTGYTVKQDSLHWWVKDTEHPYVEVNRFDWIRGYHVGGRSLMWGRQSFRLGEQDFTANLRDGIAVDWPVRYRDIAPWYDYVESFAGISGRKEGLPHLPDGVFTPAMPLNCAEEYLRDKISEHFDDRILTIGRVANITVPMNGRTSCQYRDRCIRGCPYGAYFSSNAVTLPAAEATGNMTLRPHSIVHTILFDDKRQRASGVVVKDAKSGETHLFKARIIFCCASTLGTAHILLNSTSSRFPEGMGNDSGELGHNLMDHHFRVGAEGIVAGFEDKYYKGRRPAPFYIPRFRNLDRKTDRKDYIRGYGYQGKGSRTNWQRGIAELGYGKAFKDRIMQPGPWKIGMTGFGECLPYHDNRVWIDQGKTDKFGMPVLAIDCTFRENEFAMRRDMKQSAAEMLEAAGIRDIRTWDDIGGPGLSIHEMGTARMGRDPKTSVLNKWNQIHAVPNVFVTDGSFMTSSACQNPSLTYMAFTARAADFAVNALKKGNL